MQDTIRDSVRQLLIDKIDAFGLSGRFEVLNNEIRCPGDGLIVFKGMQSYNAHNIKSLEDFDGAWIEEAQTLSDQSWRLLRPTIRKPGSEIWAGWNPRNEDDPVDAFFRGGDPHPEAVCVAVNWRDNPWFPEVLKREMEYDRLRYPDTFDNVWEGGYEIVTEAAYYAKELAQAEAEGRIGDFPFTPGVPVETSWDIGIHDYTSIWFYQRFGALVNVIDFWEINNAGLEEIMKSALPELNPDERERYKALDELGRKHAFTYGRHFMPHDIKVREWAGGAKARIQVAMELGMRADTINVGVQADPADRVAATRRLLPYVRFNKTNRVMLGVKHLRRYSRKKNEQLGTYGGPLKDGHDHAADSFGEFAINAPVVDAPPPPPKPKPQPLGTVMLPAAPQPERSTRIEL